MKIPLSEPDLSDREAELAFNAVRAGMVSSAVDAVTSAERRLAAMLARREAVCTSTGSAAIELMLRSAGIGRGDKVIAPSYTFAATINSIVHAGAEPVFCDVDEGSWTLCPVSAEAAIDRYGAKAVLAVDVLGRGADAPRLQALCDARGSDLLIDAAGSLGAALDGRPTAAAGRAAVLSFNGNKVATCGGGGAILTDDEALAQRARHLSRQARKPGGYHIEAVGMNCRMPGLNAEVLLGQLERLDGMLSRRLAITARYTEAFAGLAHLSTVSDGPTVMRNGWLYPVRTASETHARDLVAHLAAADVEARPFWVALAHEAPYRAFERVATPVSDALSGAVVSLPSNSTMTDEMADRVIEAVRAWRPAH